MQVNQFILKNKDFQVEISAFIISKNGDQYTIAYKYETIYEHEFTIDMNNTIASHRFNFRAMMMFESVDQHYTDFLKKIIRTCNIISK